MPQASANKQSLSHSNPEVTDIPEKSLYWIEKALFSEFVRDFISGSCVGAVISTIFYPLNVVRTHMQTQPVGSRHIGFYEAFQAVHQQRDGNFRALFRGVHVNYSRSFLSWGIINACYEFFHRMIQERDNS